MRFSEPRAYVSVSLCQPGRLLGCWRRGSVAARLRSRASTPDPPCVAIRPNLWRAPLKLLMPAADGVPPRFPLEASESPEEERRPALSRCTAMFRRPQETYRYRRSSPGPGASGQLVVTSSCTIASSSARDAVAAAESVTPTVILAIPGRRWRPADDSSIRIESESGWKHPSDTPRVRPRAAGCLQRL